MKKIYRFFLLVPLVLFCAIGLFSLFDADKDISVTENRGLAQKPEITLSAFLNGSLMEKLDTYYTDQFPLRERLLSVNSKMNLFYTFTKNDGSQALVIQMNNDAGIGGIGAAGSESGGKKEESVGEKETASNQTGMDPETAENPQQSEASERRQTEEKEDPEFGDSGNVIAVNSLLFVDGRAMEIVYHDDEGLDKYVTALENLRSAMPDVDMYSIVVPNDAQFYADSSYREGNGTNQKAEIDYIYNHVCDGINTVDAYSKLRKHIDEYIYFRTDHHWTQRGAYYAYTAFCEAAGLDAVPLDRFETGYVKCANTGSTTFLGTLYSNLKSYPAQASVMEANPDTCEYFFPISKCDATMYESFENGALYGAYNGITTLAREVYDSYLYMAFISGDQPIEVITTDVQNDKVCMVLKESYGNAFVPFLTSHYSKIVVVDPRKFNGASTPRLVLSELANDQKVTDLIVINYPYIPMSSDYRAFLNRLANVWLDSGN